MYSTDYHHAVADLTPTLYDPSVYAEMRLSIVEWADDVVKLSCTPLSCPCYVVSLETSAAGLQDDLHARCDLGAFIVGITSSERDSSRLFLFLARSLSNRMIQHNICEYIFMIYENQLKPVIFPLSIHLNVHLTCTVQLISSLHSLYRQTSDMVPLRGSTRYNCLTRTILVSWHVHRKFSQGERSHDP